MTQQSKRGKKVPKSYGALLARYAKAKQPSKNFGGKNFAQYRQRHQAPNASDVSQDQTQEQNNRDRMDETLIRIPSTEQQINRFLSFDGVKSDADVSDQQYVEMEQLIGKITNSTIVCLCLAAENESIILSALEASRAHLEQDAASEDRINTCKRALCIVYYGIARINRAVVEELLGMQCEAGAKCVRTAQQEERRHVLAEKAAALKGYFTDVLARVTNSLESELNKAPVQISGLEYSPSKLPPGAVIREKRKSDIGQLLCDAKLEAEATASHLMDSIDQCSDEPQSLLNGFARNLHLFEFEAQSSSETAEPEYQQPASSETKKRKRGRPAKDLELHEKKRKMADTEAKAVKIMRENEDIDFITVKFKGIDKLGTRSLHVRRPNAKDLSIAFEAEMEQLNLELGKNQCDQIKRCICNVLGVAFPKRQETNKARLDIEKSAEVSSAQQQSQVGEKQQVAFVDVGDRITAKLELLQRQLGSETALDKALQIDRESSWEEVDDDMSMQVIQQSRPQGTRFTIRFSGDGIHTGHKTNQITHVRTVNEATSINFTVLTSEKLTGISSQSPKEVNDLVVTNVSESNLKDLVPQFRVTLAEINEILLRNVATKSGEQLVGMLTGDHKFLKLMLGLMMKYCIYCPTQNLEMKNQAHLIVAMSNIRKTGEQLAEIVRSPSYVAGAEIKGADKKKFRPLGFTKYPTLLVKEAFDAVSDVLLHAWLRTGERSSEYTRDVLIRDFDIPQDKVKDLLHLVPTQKEGRGTVLAASLSSKKEAHARFDSVIKMLQSLDTNAPQPQSSIDAQNQALRDNIKYALELLFIGKKHSGLEIASAATAPHDQSIEALLHLLDRRIVVVNALVRISQQDPQHELLVESQELLSLYAQFNQAFNENSTRLINERIKKETSKILKDDLVKRLKELDDSINVDRTMAILKPILQAKLLEHYTSQGQNVLHRWSTDRLYCSSTGDFEEHEEPKEEAGEKVLPPEFLPFQNYISGNELAAIQKKISSIVANPASSVQSVESEFDGRTQGKRLLDERKRRLFERDFCRHIAQSALQSSSNAADDRTQMLKALASMWSKPNDTRDSMMNVLQKHFQVEFETSKRNKSYVDVVYTVLLENLMQTLFSCVVPEMPRPAQTQEVQPTTEVETQAQTAVTEQGVPQNSQQIESQSSQTESIIVQEPLVLESGTIMPLRLRVINPQAQSDPGAKVPAAQQQEQPRTVEIEVQIGDAFDDESAETPREGLQELMMQKATQREQQAEARREEAAVTSAQQLQTAAMQQQPMDTTSDDYEDDDEDYVPEGTISPKEYEEEADEEDDADEHDAINAAVRVELDIDEVLSTSTMLIGDIALESDLQDLEREASLQEACDLVRRMIRLNKRMQRQLKPSREMLKQRLLEYWKLLKALLRAGDHLLSVETVKFVGKKGQRLGRLFFRCFRGRRMSPYIHIISCHLAQLLVYWDGNLRASSQQAVEAKNKHIKRRGRNAFKGGNVPAQQLNVDLRMQNTNDHSHAHHCVCKSVVVE